jgi:hypothetical protein
MKRLEERLQVLENENLHLKAMSDRYESAMWSWKDGMLKAEREQARMNGSLAIVIRILGKHHPTENFNSHRENLLQSAHRHFHKSNKIGFGKIKAVLQQRKKQKKPNQHDTA